MTELITKEKDGLLADKTNGTAMQSQDQIPAQATARKPGRPKKLKAGLVDTKSEPQSAAGDVKAVAGNVAPGTATAPLEERIVPETVTPEPAAPVLESAGKDEAEPIKPVDPRPKIELAGPGRPMSALATELGQLLASVGIYNYAGQAGMALS
jgi:hypothetical protein